MYVLVHRNLYIDYHNDDDNNEKVIKILTMISIGYRAMLYDGR